MDNHDTFGKHVMEVARKAGEKVAKLTRLLTNIRGPSSVKRAVLCRVAQSITLYGAPIWYPAPNIARQK